MPGESALNEELLRTLARHLGSQEYISRVTPFPSQKPDRVVAFFREDYYPTPVSEARVELRILLSDDRTLQYIERWNGEQWECRWDRHENPHNARDHFHPPSDAGTDGCVDATYPDDPYELIGLVVQFVQDRIGDVWATQTYPSDYEWDGEYSTAFLDT
jgi:hypothetical protein